MKGKLEVGELIVMIIVEAKKEKKDVVYDGMKQMTAVVKEAGCLDCSVYKENNHENMFIFMQVWKNEEAFNEFKNNSEKLKEFQTKMIPNIVSITIRELIQGS